MAENEPQAPRNLSQHRQDNMLSLFANARTALLEFPAFLLFAIKSVYGVRTNKRSTDLVERSSSPSQALPVHTIVITRGPSF